MSLVELLAVAGSLSLLAGWRLYVCVFAAGVAMRFGVVAMPEHLAWLGALQNPWVIGAAFVGLVAELLADKVAWIDSAWDAVHTAVRPVGGALLTLAIIDPQDTSWQVVAFLLGGGAALLSHTAKAGARAMVNASPEPFSNIAVSTGEDVTTTAFVVGALLNPWIALAVFVVTLLFTLAVLLALRRLLRNLVGSPRKQVEEGP